MVKVNWQPLKNPFHPKEVFEQIKDHLPETHSPLNKLGNGSEGCYLGDINQTLGEMLMKFIKELNKNNQPTQEMIYGILVLSAVFKNFSNLGVKTDY